MSQSTTEVNVTTTITRATSKAELVDENPDLAAECVQNVYTDAKSVTDQQQVIPAPMLAKYEPMLKEVRPLFSHFFARADAGRG